MIEIKEKKMPDKRTLKYDDIEIKYNRQNRQFYFLEVEFDDENNLEYYDINNGMIVSADELKGYEHFDKSILFEGSEDFFITIGDLKRLYERVTEEKKEYISEKKEETQETQEKQTRHLANDSQPLNQEIKITGDTTFPYDELLLVYNEENTNFWFLVRKLADDGTVQTYDAVNGSLVSGKDLKGYKYYSKEAVLEAEQEYKPSQLQELNNYMNSQKVNYTFGSNSGGKFQRR